MGFFRRLYRGGNNYNFVGARKRWYILSAVLLVVCLASIGFRGFEWGIEFVGGSQFIAPQKSDVSLEQVEDAATSAGAEVQSGQTAGQGDDKTYILRTGELSQTESQSVATQIAETLGIERSEVTISSVSGSWGDQVTEKALIALGVFLLLVGAYIAIRFERKMAIAAIAALFHDILITAGIYSLVGFEVTPSTVVGLLTILGFSLYDTVVVFDKVHEDTNPVLEGNSTLTYAEGANKAVNETLMRSINTSITSLLPVGALLFVGAGLLGAGTLKDLALVLFVGLAAGTYSSIFIATPLLVEMKQREKKYKVLEGKILEKREHARLREQRESASAEEKEADVEPKDMATVGPPSSEATSQGSSSRRRGRHGRSASRKRGR